MHNHHRQQPNTHQLDRLLAAAGTHPSLVRERTTLSDATFNTAYRVRLAAGADHPGLVLKIAPRPDAPTLRYERGLMRTEELFYRVAAGRAPLPRVVHADFTREVIDSDVLVLSALPGSTWQAQRDLISDEPARRLRAELGGMVAALHRVTGTGFGYPQMGLVPGWRAAFAAMMEAVLSDAETFGVPLPASPARIRETTRAHAHLLDAVATPVLVHFDLWDGNILVDRAGPKGPRISGLVDGERAFWGDPAADLVSLGLFRDIARDEAFLDGYRSAGGRLRFDADTWRRLRLYRCYMYLIMLVEAVPRGFAGPDHQRRARYVGTELRAELDALATD